MTPWITIEQRRALRTWALVLAGPALVAESILVLALLTFATMTETARHYVGTIGIIAQILTSIPLLTYAAEISLRSFQAKFSKDGGEIDFTGESDAGSKLQDAGAALIDAGAAVKEQP